VSLKDIFKGNRPMPEMGPSDKYGHLAPHPATWLPNGITLPSLWITLLFMMGSYTGLDVLYGLWN